MQIDGSHVGLTIAYSRSVLYIPFIFMKHINKIYTKGETRYLNLEVARHMPKSGNALRDRG